MRTIVVAIMAGAVSSAARETEGLLATAGWVFNWTMTAELAMVSGFS